MPTVRETISNLTGVVTREYGSFKYGQQVQGLPLPRNIRESSLYQFIMEAPEEPDPAYHDAGERIARKLFADNPHLRFDRGDEIALEYLQKHTGHFIPPDQKKRLIAHGIESNVAVKALVGRGDSCHDIDEDIGFISGDNPLWIGYRVIVWGELETYDCKDKPPVVHYFKSADRPTLSPIGAGSHVMPPAETLPTGLS